MSVLSVFVCGTLGVYLQARCLVRSHRLRLDFPNICFSTDLLHMGEEGTQFGDQIGGSHMGALGYPDPYLEVMAVFIHTSGFHT